MGVFQRLGLTRRPPPTPAEREAELVKAFQLTDFGGRARNVDVYFEKYGVPLERAVELGAENGYAFAGTKDTRMGRAAVFTLTGTGS